MSADGVARQIVRDLAATEPVQSWYDGHDLERQKLFKQCRYCHGNNWAGDASDSEVIDGHRVMYGPGPVAVHRSDCLWVRARDCDLTTTVKADGLL